MSSETGWCTIESDPAVFSELIERLGVKGLDVEEVYDLDPSGLATLGHIHGFIFLFKWTAPSSSGPGVDKEYADSQDLFFASQIVQNACATQAILSILLNLLPSSNIKIGTELEAFRDFTRDFDPEMKGLALGEHELIRQIHNSFGRPDALYIDEESKDRSGEGGEDPFHFVSIMPVNSRVLEFDGLQPGPLVLGQAEKGRWQSVALDAIQSRIQKMSSGGQEIRFNLMAVITDRSQALQSQLEALTGETEWQRPELEALLAEDHARKAERKRENQLRKHNFIPLAMALLQCMAKRRPDLIKAAL